MSVLRPGDRWSVDDVNRSRQFVAITGVAGGLGFVGQMVLARETVALFRGNELVLGLFFGTWLLVEAVGALAGGRVPLNHRAPLVYTLLLAANAVGLLAGVGLLVLIGTVMGTVETYGVLTVFLVSLAAVFPLSISHGALYTVGCRVHHVWSADVPAESAAVVYRAETVGTLVGGLVSSLLLWRWMLSVTAALWVALALFLVLLWVQRLALHRVQPAHLALGMITWILFLAMVQPLGASLQNTVLEWRWESAVESFDQTIFGDLLVLKQNQQTTIYYNSEFAAVYPDWDSIWSQELVYLSLGVHPHPNSVLLLSGGLGGVLEELDSVSLAVMDYVELDPVIFSALPQRPENTELIPGDARRYVFRSEKTYDVIIMGAVDTTSFQVNRMFTREFFAAAAERLGKNGVLVFSTPGSDVYPGKTLLEWNRTVFHTAGEIFPHVEAVPGDRTLFFCSQRPIHALSDHELLSRRWEALGVQPPLLSEGYLKQRLALHRMAWFAELIEDRPRLGINTDMRPTAVYYGLMNWSAMFSPPMEALLHRGAGWGQWLAGSALLLFAALIAWLSTRRPQLSVHWAIGTSGLYGMCLDLLLLFWFQIVSGVLYAGMGLLTALFMAGTALGTSWSEKTMKDARSCWRCLLGGDAAAIAIALSLIAVGSSMSAITTDAAAFLLFGTLCLLAGGIVGWQYPVAAALQIRIARERSVSGSVYSSDLIGGWAGAVIGPLLLFPLFGFPATLGFLVLVKLTSTMILLVNRQVFCDLPGN